MNKLKTYQKFQFDSTGVILKKIVDFQNEVDEFRCLISLNLNCGAVITGYPVQVSCGERGHSDMVMMKDKLDEDLIYVSISSISAVRIYNAMEYVQVLSSGKFLAPVKKEDQITRLEAKRRVQQSWLDSQLNFPIVIDWDTLPLNDDDYNSYLKTTVDGIIGIFKDIAKDEIGQASLKVISEFRLEYQKNSEAQCSRDGQSIVCKFDFHFHPKKSESLKSKFEALL